MYDLIMLIKRYKLESEILRWAGSFRYLHSLYPLGFKLRKWINLNESLDEDLAKTIIRILKNEKLVSYSDIESIIISNELNLQRFLELIHILVNMDLTMFKRNNLDLLWTISSSNANDIPVEISKHFRYLYSYMQEIILTASNRIYLIAPYFSKSGIKQLLTSLNAINNNKRNISINFLVNDLEEYTNSIAFNYLKENITMKNNNTISIFEPVEKSKNKLWFHAKLLLVDNEKGYLGSANYSESGLSNQFELGVPLTPEQTAHLTTLIDYWLDNRYFKLH